MTAELQEKYGFSAQSVYGKPVPGFYSLSLSLQTVAALRCEPAVRYIEENAYGSINQTALPCIN
jgi:hypothetical protein